MIEIVTDEHYELISSLFEKAENSIRIISPFLSKRMAELLCMASHRGVECSFVTRFYLQDFIDGSNTLDGLQDMLDAGVKLYALIGLHTKLYLFDSCDSIVGSANFTEKALKLILAKTDEEKYAATAKLTDKQKDIVIVSLMKVIQEQGFDMSSIEM